jgi:hypothetical protein
MKTVPISRPGAGPAPTTNPSVQSAAAARDRAIQKLTTPPVQHTAPQAPTPVNANSVAPEDMTAIIPASVVETTTNVEAQAATPEPTKSETKVEQETQISNSQMAILARKERAIRAQLQQQKQAVEAERQQWQQEKTQLEQRLKELETGYIPKSSLKQEALEAIRRGELSYDEVTQEVMNPTDPRITATIRSLEERLAAQDRKLASYEKSTQDAADLQYKAAVKQIETDVRNLVKQDPSFEAIRFTKSEKDVVDLIEQTYKEEGYVMTVEEATQEVENYLVEEASKLARLEKIKKRITPTATPTTEVGAKQDTKQQTQQQPQQMKTLTNQASSSRKLSGRDRAILAFKGELKS